MVSSIYLQAKGICEVEEGSSLGYEFGILFNLVKEAVTGSSLVLQLRRMWWRKGNMPLGLGLVLQ